MIITELSLLANPTAGLQQRWSVAPWHKCVTLRLATVADVARQCAQPRLVACTHCHWDVENVRSLAPSSSACSMQGVVPYGPKTIRKYKHGWVATNYCFAGMEDGLIFQSPTETSNPPHDVMFQPQMKQRCQAWHDALLQFLMLQYWKQLETTRKGPQTRCAQDHGRHA